MVCQPALLRSLTDNNASVCVGKAQPICQNELLWVTAIPGKILFQPGKPYIILFTHLFLLGSLPAVGSSSFLCFAG